MGCDIHAVIEKRHVNAPWEEVVEPNIRRNYGMFAALAGVRNYESIEPIDDPRGVPRDASRQYRDMVELWAEDGHSHSWLTLDEMREFDPTRFRKWARWEDAEWDDLKQQMEEVAHQFDGDGSRVRLCFLFDN